MFVSENKYNEQAKKIKDLEDTIRRINNDKNKACYRVNKLECDNWNLRTKVGNLNYDNDKLKIENKDLVSYKDAFYARGLTNAKLRDRVKKLDKIIIDKNAQIESLENSITEICKAKDDLQQMCNDRYHLIKKYQDRCNWYSDLLRKNRELTQQLKEELEHKANFMCKPFLKEHEDMKKDLKRLLNGIAYSYYKSDSVESRAAELRYAAVEADRLMKKWFADK